MNDRQQTFVKEYLVDLNATQAAIRAGYSEKTARKIGSENLTKPDIAAAIQANMDERSKRVEIDADYVLRTIKNTTDALVAGDTERNAQAIFKGCELLGRNLKLFTDKHEHTGENGKPLFGSLEDFYAALTRK